VKKIAANITGQRDLFDDLILNIKVSIYPGVDQEDNKIDIQFLNSKNINASLIELSSQYTTYSLHVAMSLK
jgi:hypothetical protein